ncbi:S8 family serine peptidase [Cellulomonas sp. DKR-3]|uniref:S8 family serine peptidase n=1 Tax=Cellulomonas fulva TaxID=2835530 RepID=A0ABS5U312_9CELL|nr:S8 family serine peptidase [Cellulomonas fulva]MBT0995757.1 S8 family serine peptidase [Cellulomonas fulva]
MNVRYQLECHRRNARRTVVAVAAAAALVVSGGVAAQAGAVRADAAASPSVRTADPQDGPAAAEFDGYVGYHAGETPGADAAATDEPKTTDPGPVPTPGYTTPDVPGQHVAAPRRLPAVAPLPSAPDPAQVAKVRDAITAHGTARVTVTAAGALRTDLRSATALAAQHERTDEAQAALSATLAGTGSRLEGLDPLLPAGVWTVTEDGLDALLDDPGVGSVTIDGSAQADLATSTGVIDSDLLNTAGVLGNNFEGGAGGYQVAIIDSGVDNQHNAFTGRIVSQACFVTDSSCPGGTNSSTAAGSADECTHSNDCDHGTHVAGIAAGGMFTGGHEGVARGAGVVAIKVAQDNPSSARWTAQFSAINNALARVFALKTSTNPRIVSVNLSIGTNAVFAPGDAACAATNPSTNTWFSLLQGQGVAVVVAAGNNGSSAGMSFPGCLTTGFAIGATTDGDVPASFTNSTSDLRWWAPGVSIDAPVPTGDNHGFKDGTSMAAPHVAGAFALLRECVDGNGVPITNAAAAANLDATGVNVTRAGVTRKRINVLDAATRTVNNNDFASAEALSGNGPFNDFDFTVCSDTEPGEPGPFSLDNGVWWRWTPATTGTATISTEDNGTSVTTFDTTLAVYTGGSLATLTPLAWDDDSGTGARSLVTFPVNGGTTYRIKVDGFAAANGLLNLHVENGPPPTCQGVAATMVGTPGNDTLTGTAGNDVIVAGAGDDVIRGLAGNDRICGDAGADSILGGEGDDVVFGGSGADTIGGEAGNDTLLGNPGGGSTDDTGDSIDGGAGNDWLDGWTGDDTLVGGTGDDQILGVDGTDTVSYAASLTAVRVNLATGAATGEGTDTLSQVENAVGSSKSDTLQGSSGPNVLRAGAGNDAVLGGGGADTLTGDDGNDTIGGGADNDAIQGGAGDDTLNGDDGADTIRGGTGDDQIRGSLGGDKLYGDAGNDRILAYNGKDSVDAGPGADFVDGGADTDVVTGGADNDTVRGGTGNDTVRGGTGNDKAFGDAGDDKVFGEAGNDALNGGGGTDSCSGGTGTDTSTQCESRTSIP